MSPIAVTCKLKSCQAKEFFSTEKEVTSWAIKHRIYHVRFRQILKDVGLVFDLSNGHNQTFFINQKGYRNEMRCSNIEARL